MVTVKSSVVPLGFTSFAWKLYIIFAGFLKFFSGLIEFFGILSISRIFQDFMLFGGIWWIFHLLDL